MARIKKNTAVEEVETDMATVENKTIIEAVEEVEIPANIEKLMKLYPQYESFYATSAGFVHPTDAPQYLVKDATLYQNKYYKS